MIVFVIGLLMFLGINEMQPDKFQKLIAFCFPFCYMFEVMMPNLRQSMELAKIQIWDKTSQKYIEG